MTPKNIPDTQRLPMIHSDGTGAAYIQAATSENTRLAYQADIQDFLKKGGVLPATPTHVEGYLKTCAPDTNPRTLVRRLTALRQWHRLRGVTDPTALPLVTKTLRGIARLHGRPKVQAVALRLKELDQLITMLKASSEEGLEEGSKKGSNEALKKELKKHAVRNQALLLVGFFGAFRRSELVALTWEQVFFVSEGIMITLPRSKTDQTGEGERCVIPFGNKKRCPVRALIAWRQASGCNTGFIFRRISKEGALSDQPITPHHWNRLIRAMAKKAGLPQWEQYSSHSLRRGFATEAARLGAPMAAIQRHGRWQCTKTVIEYIEAGRQFTDSAVNVLFDYDHG